IRRLAEVCCTKTVQRPSATPAARTASCTTPVMSCRPCPCVSTLSALTIGAGFERRNRWELLSLQELEKRATRGGDVVDPLGDAELVDRRHRVAAAGDGERLRIRDGAGEGFSTLGKGVI